MFANEADAYAGKGLRRTKFVQDRASRSPRSVTMPSMRTGHLGRSLATLVALLAGALALAAPAAAAPNGPIATQCSQVDQRLITPCYGLDQLARDAAADCRYAGAAPDGTCVVPPEPAVTEKAIEDFQGSPTDQALKLQYALGSDLPLRNAPWIGTHNSFNSIAEMGPTLSDTDSNQQLSIPNLLRIDVRAIEIDAHWFPSASNAGGQAPVICHGQDNHAGCTIERPMSSVLAEIATWLAHNRGQVLLLYIEDHLNSAIDSSNGYGVAAGVINSQLGPLVYRPTNVGPGCQSAPLALTRNQVLAAGAQVVIVDNSCGDGNTAWQSQVFNWGSSHFEDRPTNFSYPSCGGHDQGFYDSTLVRYYEDSTWLTTFGANVGQSSVDDGLTPATVGAMVKCGVDLFGFDQLLPGDGRLAAAIWTWAAGQPTAAGECAIQRASDGRWEARDCGEQHQPACRNPDGSWQVPATATSESSAAAECSAAGAAFAVPRTGADAERLSAAAGPADVWIALNHSSGSWAPAAGAS
jgi:hypothetical protein